MADKDIVRVNLVLNKKTDADIIEYLETATNKNATIRQALREKIELEEGVDNEMLEKIKAVVRECGEKRVEELLELRTKPVGNVN